MKANNKKQLKMKEKNISSSDSNKRSSVSNSKMLRVVRRESFADNMTPSSRRYKRPRNSKSLEDVFDTQFHSQRFFVDLISNQYDKMNEYVFKDIIEKSPICGITQKRCEFIMADCAEDSEGWNSLSNQIQSYMMEFNSPNAKFGTWTEMYEELRNAGIFLPPQQSRLRKSKNRERIDLKQASMIRSADISDLRAIPRRRYRKSIGTAIRSQSANETVSYDLIECDNA